MQFQLNTLAVILSNKHKFSQNYSIQNPIGRGAGSFVCKVTCRSSQKEYAAKIVQKSNQNPKVLIRVQNEIKIHSQLDHKNIVKLHNHMEDQDNYYLIMELCDHDIKEKTKMTELQIRNYGRQIAQGLQYLHSKNIIHRDLKLANLLLQGDIVKIADFGLATQLSDSADECNTLCGTPNYISPEILNNQPYGKKVDLWSFGCCLYAMITGHGPFEQDQSSTLGDVLKRVKTGNFNLPIDVSVHLKDLLVNLINLNADQRYTVEEILKHPFFREEPLSPNFPLAQKFTKTSSQVTNFEQNYTTFGADEAKSQEKSKLKELMELSPFVQKEEVLRRHRQTSSMASFSSNVNQFLQNQQSGGSKKLLFGLTTMGKSQINKKQYDIYKDNMPKFSLSKEHQIKQMDRIKPSDEIIKKLGLDDDSNKENEKQNYSNDRFGERYTNAKTASKQIVSFSNQKVSPLKTDDLKPCKLQTKNCQIQIFDDGTFEMEMTNKSILFTISQEGRQILVNKKNQKNKIFSLDQLPQKLMKFYIYSKQVVNTIKEKYIKYKMENQCGLFILRIGKNGHIFESSIKKSQIKVNQIKHELNSEYLEIKTGQNQIEKLSLKEFQLNHSSMDPNKVLAIKLTLKYLAQCLKDRYKD